MGAGRKGSKDATDASKATSGGGSFVTLGVVAAMAAFAVGGVSSGALIVQHPSTGKVIFGKVTDAAAVAQRALDECQSTKTDCSKAQNELGNVKKTLEGREEEISTLREANAVLAANMEQVKKSTKESEEMKDLTKKLDAAENEKKNALQNAQASFGKLQKVEADLTNASTQMEDLLEEKRDLEQKLKIAEEAAGGKAPELPKVPAYQIVTTALDIVLEKGDQVAENEVKPLIHTWNYVFKNMVIACRGRTEVPGDVTNFVQQMQQLTDQLYANANPQVYQQYFQNASQMRNVRGMLVNMGPAVDLGTALLSPPMRGQMCGNQDCTVAWGQ